MKIKRILETALYVDDLPRAMAFYQRLFGFAILVQDERFCSMDVNGQSILLLFLRGGSLQANPTPGGVIPAHDGQGPVHMAFAIDSADLELWERKLSDEGVTIESRVVWARGGTSLYFRDPDDHALELATPGIWATY
jgi:catechol 2,3-dioxygenase-like lactoylglutathione lyase family enzyme